MTSWKSYLWRFVRRLLLAVILIALIVGGIAWYKLLREVPQELAFNSPEEQYKYGSIGTENEEGLPYYIWLVLPRMFPEYLPVDNGGDPRGGGYAAFGFAWEQGRETPVGFSKKTIGFPRIAVNCAACHTATYRTAPDEIREIVPTGPAVQTDVLSYVNFLSKCASDPRFNSQNLLYQIEYNFDLSALDKLLYYSVIIPMTKKALLEQGERFTWTSQHGRTPWGPGRIEPFNPVKFNQLEMSEDKTIGTSDVMPIWNLANRTGALHWDGLNTDAAEVVYSGAIGDGATNKSLPYEKLNELLEYVNSKQPPRYPFADTIDLSQAKTGKEIYNNYCAECHAIGGPLKGTVIPLNEIGTDGRRADMWIQEAVERYSHFSDGYPWDFEHFQNVEGYVAVPLDGLWLRAPYLHNGSVPTMEALLEPAANRPSLFYRGYDVYDTTTMGFKHRLDDPVVKKWGHLYDVRHPGNGNQGHEGARYGTELKPVEKKALIEYLKTL